jgi:SAM-dependent methyltransferase
VTLCVNGVPSSYLDLDDPGFLAFEYMQIMDALLAGIPDGPISALHLGAAGCALARAWDSSRPGSSQIAVDIDERLTVLVRQWFDLPRAPRLRLRAQDAFDAAATARPSTFDVVVRDVFAGDTTPSRLTTAQMAENIRRALKPGGMYLVNCADRPPLPLVRRELATIAAAFAAQASGDGMLALVAEPGILKGRRYGNLVIAAVVPFEDADTRAAAPLVDPTAKAPASAGETTARARASSSDTTARASASPSEKTAKAAATKATRRATEQSPLTQPAVGRRLRNLPVPMTTLTGDELRQFIGSAKPITN